MLEDDPLEIGAEHLKDVRVWGTVQGGRVFRPPQRYERGAGSRSPCIGGYLGAGKTTLVNHLLRNAGGRAARRATARERGRPPARPS